MKTILNSDKMKTILNSDKFNLVSSLTTINVIKIQDDLWKIIENGNYSGEKNDNEIIEMVERLSKKDFKTIIPVFIHN